MVARRPARYTRRRPPRGCAPERPSGHLNGRSRFRRYRCALGAVAECWTLAATCLSACAPKFVGRQLSILVRIQPVERLGAAIPFLPREGAAAVGVEPFEPTP